MHLSPDKSPCPQSCSSLRFCSAGLTSTPTQSIRGSTFVILLLSRSTGARRVRTARRGELSSNSCSHVFPPCQESNMQLLLGKHLYRREVGTSRFWAIPRPHLRQAQRL